MPKKPRTGNRTAVRKILGYTNSCVEDLVPDSLLHLLYAVGELLHSPSVGVRLLDKWPDTAPSLPCGDGHSSVGLAYVYSFSL